MKIKVNVSDIYIPVKTLRTVASKGDNRLAVSVKTDSVLLQVQGSPVYGEYRLPMINNETFEFIVNHSFFNEILSKVSSEEIEIILTETNKVSILDGDTKFEIPVVDGKVYAPDTDVTKTSKVFTPEVWAVSMP